MRSPLNEPIPGMAGMFGSPEWPVAMTMCRGWNTRVDCPEGVERTTVAVQCFFMGSQMVLVTVLVVQTFSSMLLAYDSNQSPSLSFGV